MLMSEWQPGSGMSDEHSHGYQPAPSNEFTASSDEEEPSVERSTEDPFSTNAFSTAENLSQSRDIMMMPQIEGRSFDSDLEMMASLPLPFDDTPQAPPYSHGTIADASRNQSTQETAFAPGAYALTASPVLHVLRGPSPTQMLLLPSAAEQQPPYPPFDAQAAAYGTTESLSEQTLTDANQDVLSPFARLPTNQEETEGNKKPAAKPSAASATKKPHKARRFTKPSARDMERAKTTRAKDALKTWYKRLAELSKYKDEHGNCKVPQKYTPNRVLGIWVNKQRMEYKAWNRNEKCSLTEDKISALEELGFVWAKEKGDVSWEERFNELLEFRAKEGNCHVPNINSVVYLHNDERHFSPVPSIVFFLKRAMGFHPKIPVQAVLPRQEIDNDRRPRRQVGGSWLLVEHDHSSVNILMIFPRITTSKSSI